MTTPALQHRGGSAYAAGMTSLIGMDYTLIRSYLDDVRAAMSADEAVFWTLGAAGAELSPSLWSPEGDIPPTFSRSGNHLELALWAVQEKSVQTDGSDQLRFAVAPVAGAFELAGALSVASITGFAIPKQVIRERLERHSRQLAGLYELLVTRDQYSRSSQQTTALVNAAQRFTTHRSLEALSASIADVVVEMTGGRAVALARWSADAGWGEVVFATEEARASAGTLVIEDSQVGRACVEDIPLIMEDARPLTDYGCLYNPSEIRRPLGALAIVPLRGAERKEVIGAIVVEGGSPRDIRPEDSKNLRLLGMLAGGSLETVWEIEEITRRATVDPLTGLYNRGYFENLLRHMVAEAERFGGSSSLVMLDIDHFKQVNDTYGHLAGDAALKVIADVLSQRVRAVDSCARYGGEELALLLPRTDLEGAVELADRLREAIMDTPVEWNGNRLQLTVSAGVAAYPECARSPEALVAAADHALYAAKAAGRNCVRAARVVAS